ncbi:octopamine receptor-like [Anneissia japonica]|uniref:octopamine receptor-like n=1 Tax=Anneissia japonica TaxID=1529436 RepID=UPI00142558AB|nr:octopamine receptor-like [Anneissia japonica]
MEATGIPVTGGINESQTTTSTETSSDLTHTVALTFCLSIMAIIGIIGNTLVIIAVCKNRQLRTATNWFIVSLAFADLFVCVAIIPFALAFMAIGRWVLGIVMCYIWSSLDIMCCTASTLSLCAVSLDRYWAITSPLKYTSLMSFKRCRLIIMFIWIFSFTLAMTQLLWELLPDISENPERCSYSKNKAFRLYSSASSFFIPISISVVIYCRIFSVAHRQARRISIQENIRRPSCLRRISQNELNTEIALQNKSPSISVISNVFNQIDISKAVNLQKNNKDGLPKKTVRRALSVISSDTGSIRPHFPISRDWKALKTTVVVVGVFIFCWIPFATTYVLEVFCEKCEFSPTLLSLVLWLGYGNSVVNPVIYTLLNRAFRKAFKHLIFRKSRFGSSGSVGNDNDPNNHRF